MKARFLDPDVQERVRRLELPFNSLGLDPFGVSRDALEIFFSGLKVLYRHYFRVRVHDIAHVPNIGRALLIGNHSGGLPVDAGMLLCALLFDHEPPRLLHAMVDKFVASWPFIGPLYQRCGQLPGLPENAVRLLENDRLLLVFPEGAKGTGKLYKDRYRLERFGTGFVRLALQTQSPIIPFAFVGGEEALPTVMHLRRLAKLVGAPYIPITPYVVPWPLPVSCAIHFGAPITFSGSGTESDDVVQGYVDRIVAKIQELIDKGRSERKSRSALGRLLASAGAS